MTLSDPRKFHFACIDEWGRGTDQKYDLMQTLSSMSLGDSIHTLQTLREGLALITRGSKRISVISRLSNDVDGMWTSLRTLWESVGEAEDYEPGAELSSFKTGSKYYGLASDRPYDDLSPDGKKKDENNSLTRPESAAHAGSTLAASIGTSVVSLIPSVLIGTQSVFTTLVQTGVQTAIPTYVVHGSKLVVAHYTIFTSSTPITGWFPHHIVAISPLCIPVFSGVFFLASSLDSLHSYSHNHCSLRSALINSAQGAAAGGAIGLLYYGLVTSFGVAHAPLISAGLCVGWLLSLYSSQSLSSADLVVGSVANLAGVSAFLLTGNPVLAVAAALLGSAVGSAAHFFASASWEKYLLHRLQTKARAVLGVDPGASRREIESKYRQLARGCHPDKTNKDSTEFELIHVAKEILLLPSAYVSARPELPADYLDTPD